MANVSAFPIVGKPDCPPFKVPPFGRLYIPNEQPPPEPIDGPVPASPYILPLPAPNPCVCLSFTIPPTVAPDSRLRLVPPDANPKGLSLAIKPVDGENCCDGRFNIMPDLELPCVPFTLKDAVTNITIVNGQGHPTRPGNAVAAIKKFSLTPNGCELTPELDMWMSCIPFEIKEGEASIERGGSAKITKFGIEQDECSIRPSISMTMPCIPTQEYEYVIKTYDKGVETELRPETEVVDVDDEEGGEENGEVKPCKVKVSTKMDLPCPISVDANELAFSTGTPGTVTLRLEKEADGCGVRLVSTVNQQPGGAWAGPSVWVDHVEMAIKSNQLYIVNHVKRRSATDGKVTDSTVEKATGIYTNASVVRSSTFAGSSFVNEKTHVLALSSTPGISGSETVFTTIAHRAGMD